MNEFQNNKKSQELGAIPEAGHSLAPSEEVNLNLLDHELEIHKLRRYVSTGPDGSIVDIVGSPLATVRITDQGPDSGHVDYLLVDMTVLPENPDGHRTTFTGQVRKERTLPDGSHVNGDIAVIRPKADGTVDTLRIDASNNRLFVGLPLRSSENDDQQYQDLELSTSNDLMVAYDPIENDVILSSLSPNVDVKILPPDQNLGEDTYGVEVDFKMEVLAQRGGAIAVRDVMNARFDTQGHAAGDPVVQNKVVKNNPKRTLGSVVSKVRGDGSIDAVKLMSGVPSTSQSVDYSSSPEQDQKEHYKVHDLPPNESFILSLDGKIQSLDDIREYYHSNKKGEELRKIAGKCVAVLNFEHSYRYDWGEVLVIDMTGLPLAPDQNAISEPELGPLRILPNGKYVRGDVALVGRRVGNDTSKDSYQYKIVQISSKNQFGASSNEFLSKRADKHTNSSNLNYGFNVQYDPEMKELTVSNTSSAVRPKTQGDFILRIIYGGSVANEDRFGGDPFFWRQDVEQFYERTHRIGSWKRSGLSDFLRNGRSKTGK